MKSFLQELADQVKVEYPNWDQLTVVFPNRRAALYFKQELAKDLTTPRWAPTIITIEELIQSYSTSQEADKLELILRLYQSFRRVTGSIEKIDQFYYWGEMLLRDFDELDKYMVNAEWLFRDISNLKEVDQYFDFLTEEQKEFLKEFWQSVEFSTEETRTRFLSLWQNLYPVYVDFQTHLKKDGIAYACWCGGGRTRMPPQEHAPLARLVLAPPHPGGDGRPGSRDVLLRRSLRAAVGAPFVRRRGEARGALARGLPPACASAPRGAP